MADVPTAPNLEALNDTYEILGELHGSERAKTYVARRKDDGDVARRKEDDADVMITVVMAPPGSENNELSHFAADVKLRSNLAHPSIARVFETRWLGGSALAVVSERIQGTTLGEALERREKFSNPRIASVLQEVMGALDWARAHGVVHRGIAPDELFFLPDTQRVIVSLMPTTIPITGVPDATSDARTIGMLAWTMLAGETYAQGEAQKPLAELAPNLATRVVDATDKMVHSKNENDGDIPTFLGVIGAGDALKQAEVELAAQKELYDEQHRAELLKCENHRVEVEQHAAEQAAQLAADRAAMEKQAADNAAALEAERVEVQRVMAERDEQLAGVRAELEKQGQELERRLAEFDKRRKEFEQFRADEQRRMADARASQQLAFATAAAERAAAQWAAVERAAAEKAASANASADATAAPVVVPEGECLGPDLPPEFDVPELRFPEDETEYQKPEHIRGLFAGLDTKAVAAAPPKRDRRRWKAPAMAAAIVLLVATAVGGIHYMNSVNAPKDKVTIGKSTVIATPPTIDSRGLPRGGFMSQTAGGALATPAFGSSLGAQPTSAASTAAVTPLDTTKAAATDSVAPKPRPKPKPKPAEPANDVNGVVPSSVFDLPSRAEFVRDSVLRARRDTIIPRDTALIRRDTTIRPDTSIVRRDTAITRRDTTVRRDSLGRPDTTVKRDSVRIRPDSGGIRLRHQ